MIIVDPVPYRWFVLDSKGNPIVTMPTQKGADEFKAKGYTVFPVYRELNKEKPNE